MNSCRFGNILRLNVNNIREIDLMRGGKCLLLPLHLTDVASGGSQYILLAISQGKVGKGGHINLEVRKPVHRREDVPVTVANALNVASCIHIVLTAQVLTTSKLIAVLIYTTGGECH